MDRERDEVRSHVEIIDLSVKGLSREDCTRASKWMAVAFADARNRFPLLLPFSLNTDESHPQAATPALTIFFGAAPHRDNKELHETFWASHLNRVAASGTLLGARLDGDGDGDWRGFRCFFDPGKGRLPYTPEFVSQLPLWL